MSLEEISSVAIMAILSLIALWTAIKLRFFRKIEIENAPSYPLPTVLLCFAIFFLTTYLLFPVVAQTIFDALSLFLDLHKIPLDVLEAFAYCFTIFLTLFVIFTLLASASKKDLHLLIKDFSYENTSPIKWDIAIGCFAWLISIPLVNFVSQFSSLLVDFIFHKVIFEQDAITYLKQSKDHPISLIFTAFTITLLAPLLEELVFRGVLQNYFTAKFGAIFGIIISSTIFAFVHYSTNQGLGNISLLLSLFTLSLIMGYTYYRQRSLIAPFTLHAVFNSFTTLQLIFGEG